jgi:GGDEF domain-containing protein
VRILKSLPEHLGASAGVATWDRRETLAGVLLRADHALYQAKRAGRRLISISGPLK